ncbi:MAG: hypothetical protein IJF42_06405 [Clostridia bacterium]|nr:hypothetical protein [Clostridia bacterium]
MPFPSSFEQRMQRLLGEDYAAFAAAYDAPLARGVRVNTLKISATAFCERFPFALTQAPFAADGYYTDEGWKAGVEPWHHGGAYYMQEPSAMSAVTVLAPQKHERVLDLCAAPGGKSTQIAAALAGTGLLWSNEYVKSRALILAQNIERCGVANAVVSNMDTQVLCRKLAGQFDAVLADVPCSGEGMFRKEPDALAMWSEENIAHCVARGRDILEAAAEALRDGGRLVYSTCTFAPEENECQIAAFLIAHPEFSLELIATDWGRPAFSWERVASFAPQVAGDNIPTTYARRILPQDGGEGHFIALLRKNGDGAVPTTAARAAKADKNAAACRALWEDCFTLPPAGELVTVGDTVRLLPPAMPFADGLYIISAGVAAATVCRDRLEPHHAAFAAQQPQNCRRVLNLTRDDPRTAAFLRGEAVTAPTDLVGWTAVAVDGVVVGYGKVSGGTLKNRYPKGLRLRQG